MNWLKWIECWWNKKHVFATFYNKEQQPCRKCIRCGYEDV